MSSGMIALLALSVVLAGHYRISTRTRYKFKNRKSDNGQKVYLTSLEMGAPYAYFSFAITLPVYLWLDSLAIFSQYTSADYYILFLALVIPVIAIIQVFLSNKIHKDKIQEYQRLAARESGNDLDTKITEAAFHGIPILIELKNKSYYIGTVTSGIDVSKPQNQYITIISLGKGLLDENNRPADYTIYTKAID